jgi:hypothetical protein
MLVFGVVRMFTGGWVGLLGVGDGGRGLKGVCCGLACVCGRCAWRGQRAVKPVLMGRDVIAQAQSGEPLG